MLSTEKSELKLLQFALNRAGVQLSSYYLSNEDRNSLEFGNEECVTCLGKYQGKWAVCIQSDRYIILQLAIHDQFISAASDFWHRCMRTENHFAYMNAWERETGLEIKYE